MVNNVILEGTKTLHMFSGVPTGIYHSCLLVLAYLAGHVGKKRVILHTFLLNLK